MHQPHAGRNDSPSQRWLMSIEGRFLPVLASPRNAPSDMDIGEIYEQAT